MRIMILLWVALRRRHSDLSFPTVAIDMMQRAEFLIRSLPDKSHIMLDLPGNDGLGFLDSATARFVGLYCSKSIDELGAIHLYKCEDFNQPSLPLYPGAQARYFRMSRIVLTRFRSLSGPS